MHSLVPAVVALASLIAHVRAQNLSVATNDFPQLSQFRNLLEANPQLVPKTNVSSVFTILIPSDDAFADFEAATGYSVSSLDPDTLANYFNYHTIDGGLDLATGSNVLANTELNGQVYNLRNGTEGQVLVIEPKPAQGNNTHAIVKSGGGHQVNMNVIDGSWQGGSFQIVDGFLSLPKTCTDTMAEKTNGWTTLISALDRTNLTDVLNTFPNVTCLAPNNAAFANAGNPDLSLPVSQLASALEYHTLVGAQYSTGYKDGDVFSTANGLTVKVSVKSNGTTFFNDAMVLQQDVITNNGVIHVLDRIMSVMNETTSSTTSTTSTPPATSTSAGSSSATSSKSPSATPNAAGKILGSSYFPAVIALAALAV